MVKKLVLSVLLFAGITNAATEEDHEVMARRIQESFTTNAHLFNASKDKDIVAFLGNTGAGKSTLVNILAGIKVIAHGPEYVLEDPSDPRAMKIGEGGDSQTIYPQYVDVGDLRYFDLPGFNDTDGSEQNLVNAAFIYQILTKAKTVRPVFVVGEGSFTTDRGESVKRLFAAIQKLGIGGTGENFLSDGTLVVTQSFAGGMYPSLSDYVDFLLKKISSAKRPFFAAHMHGWMTSNRLRYIPAGAQDLTGHREHINGVIGVTAVKTIEPINISAIYPEETLARLENVFYGVMGGTFGKEKSDPPKTLMEYDERIQLYEREYWKWLEEEVLREVPSVSLLKEFSGDPYQRALDRFKKDKEGARKDRIKELQQLRGKRVQEIEKGAIEEAQKEFQLIDAGENDPLQVDFMNRDRIYEVVSGRMRLRYGEEGEQKIVKQTYDDFTKLRTWYQIQRMKAGKPTVATKTLEGDQPSTFLFGSEFREYERAVQEDKRKTEKLDSADEGLKKQTCKLEDDSYPPPHTHPPQRLSPVHRQRLRGDSPLGTHRRDGTHLI